MGKREQVYQNTGNREGINDLLIPTEDVIKGTGHYWQLLIIFVSVKT